MVENDVDIPFANGDEVRALYQVGSLEEALTQVRGRCEVVAMTRSEKGSLVSADGAVHEVPAEPVERVVNTTGADASYAAGFLYGLTRGLELPVRAPRLDRRCGDRLALRRRPQVSLAELATPALVYWVAPGRDGAGRDRRGRWRASWGRLGDEGGPVGRNPPPSLAAPSIRVLSEDDSGLAGCAATEGSVRKAPTVAIKYGTRSRVTEFFAGKVRCSIMANIPDDLMYTKDHEWVRQNGAVVVVGLTDYAQRQLGEVVFVELPNVGDHCSAGEEFGTVESVKAVSEIYAPVTGEVFKVNAALSDSPENIGDDPYGDGWVIEIRMADDTQATGLLTPAEYTAYIQEEGS